MRMIVFAGLAALTLTAPAALSAQQQLPGGPESAAQANAETPVASTTTTVSTSPEGTTTVAVNNAGNLAPPPTASLNKSYPVCTAKMQDNCQNRGEGGAPGRSRALSYWPGKPASESGR